MAVLLAFEWGNNNLLRWCSLLVHVVVVLLLIPGEGVVWAICWQANIIDEAVTRISWIVEFMLDMAMEVDSGRVWFGERITPTRVCTSLTLSFRIERLKRRVLECEADPDSTEGDTNSSCSGNIWRWFWKLDVTLEIIAWFDQLITLFFFPTLADKDWFLIYI